MRWIKRNGIWESGPFPFEQLRSQVHSGKLSRHTKVRLANSSQWQAADEIADLFSKDHLSPLVSSKEPLCNLEFVPQEVDATSVPKSQCIEPPPVTYFISNPRGMKTILMHKSVLLPALFIPLMILFGTGWYVWIARKSVNLEIAAIARQNKWHADLGELCLEIQKKIANEDVAAADTDWARLSSLLEGNREPKWGRVAEDLHNQIRSCEARLNSQSIWQQIQQALNLQQLDSVNKLLLDYLAQSQVDRHEEALTLQTELAFATNQTAINKMVADWDGPLLSQVLADRRLPNPPTLINTILLAAYENTVLDIAVLEAKHRVELARFKERERAEAIARDEVLRREEKAEKRRAWLVDNDNQGVFGIIPSDVAGAIATPSFDKLVGSVSGLLRKLARTEWRNAFKLAQTYVVDEFAPANMGFDHSRPMAVLLANPEKAVDLLDNDLSEWIRLMVLVVATNDIKSSCKHWKVDPLAIIGGSAIKAGRNAIPFFQPQTYVARRGDYWFIGFDEQIVNSVSVSYANKKSLVAIVRPDDGRALLDQELLLYSGTGTWGQIWIQLMNVLESGFDVGDEDPDSIATWESFVTTARHTEYGMIGIKIDGGIQIQALASFSEHANAQVQHFLTLLNAGTEPPSLFALPHDHALWAFAARGEGLANVVTAHALFNVAWDHFLTRNALKFGSDRPRHLKTLSKAWRQIVSARAALYHVGAGGKTGRVATVAILEVADPSEFISSIREFVQHANQPNLNAAKRGLAQALPFGFLEAELDGEQTYTVVVTDTFLADHQKQDAALELGADWNQLRIVPGDGMVILFLGSELGILRQAILNIKNRSPGLEENPAVANTIAQHDPNRKMQLGVSVGGTLSYLTKSGPLLVTPQHYSTTSLTITNEQFKLGISLPLQELKAAVSLSSRSGF